MSAESRRQWVWYLSALVYRWTDTAASRAVDTAIFDYLGEDLRDARVLDCGCGPGHLTQALTQLGVAHVVAVDANPTMVNQAKRLLTRAEVAGHVEVHRAHVNDRFFASDRSAPIQADYDVIVFKRSLYASHGDAISIIGAAAGSLTANGVLVVAHPDRRLRRYAFGDQWPWWKPHTAYHLANRALSRLAAFFRISNYRAMTETQLVEVLRTAVPDARVDVLPSTQRAYCIVALRPQSSRS